VAEIISVIVATYNRPDALNAVLRGLSRQTDRDFEVIVADDGSGPATKQAIFSWRAHFGVRLRHVWHEDHGFRLAEIRNRAILACSGRYCVFLDGDCIPRPDFVAAHRALAEPGWFVAGNRLLLSRVLTEQVLGDGSEPEVWGPVAWLAARLRGGIDRIAPLIRLPLGSLRKLQRTHWQGARGGNLAIWRDDLVRVDGFDAAFAGWGREDSDIILRLLRTGLGRKDGRFATGVLHLWHPEADRSRLGENEGRLAELLTSSRIRAQRGISALAAAASEQIMTGASRL
jgi:glycosyltransferase involved in cell wall biosynthesis